MLREKIAGLEVLAARMPGARHQLHLFRHPAVGCLALHGSAGEVWAPVPNFDAASADFTMTAKSTFVGLQLLLVRIVMIGKELLCHGDVNLAFGLLDQFFPSEVSRVGRGAQVVGIEVGLFLDELRIASKV